MYPLISLAPGIDIHSFGLFMSISLFVFFISLYKIGKKEHIQSDVFFSLFLICIGVIFFGRLLYIVAEWRDHKFLITQFTNGQSTFWELMSGFIIMKNYNLAFMGGVLGFFVSVYIQLKRHSAYFKDLIDSIMPSFFYAGIFGYFGAFLGEQIYGVPSELLGLIHPAGSSIPYSGGIFPLALVYMALCIVGSICWYSIRKKIGVRGGAGYISLALFSGCIFLGEFFAGSEDIFASYMYLNLTQIGSLVLILFALHGIFTLSVSTDTRNNPTM